jgi:two-component system nitrate/nitrite sensor histidine kinase NarX
LHNVYLIRRLRSRVIADERARLARELHDSVIQSLIGLEMGVAAMAASTSSVSDVAECTTYVRDTLRDEIANIRDLMHSFRSIDVSGSTLPGYLSDLADRFERDSGIRTMFVCETSTERLPRRWCIDVARVAQEALVNVRKHSGATVVTMRLAGDEKGLTLRVNDNGRGFTFSGRLDDQELWHQHKGPLVIKERARAIGASVAVESTPGHGASVEMSLSYGV